MGIYDAAIRRYKCRQNKLKCLDKLFYNFGRLRYETTGIVSLGFYILDSHDDDSFNVVEAYNIYHNIDQAEQPKCFKRCMACRYFRFLSKRKCRSFNSQLLYFLIDHHLFSLHCCISLIQKLFYYRQSSEIKERIRDIIQTYFNNSKHNITNIFDHMFPRGIELFNKFYYEHLKNKPQITLQLETYTHLPKVIVNTITDFI